MKYAGARRPADKRMCQTWTIKARPWKKSWRCARAAASSIRAPRFTAAWPTPGLRPSGRGIQKQHQARLVEEVCAGERHQRGAGLCHSDESAGVGWPSGHVGGFSDPLMDCKACKTRHRADKLIEDTGVNPRRLERRADALLHPRAQHRVPGVRQVRLYRHPQVQPDVQDLPGRDRGQQERALPAARDGAGHLCQLQEHPAHHPPQDSLWRGADWKILPQRNHARKLHLPHPRV